MTDRRMTRCKYDHTAEAYVTGDGQDRAQACENGAQSAGSIRVDPNHTDEVLGRQIEGERL